MRMLISDINLHSFRMITKRNMILETFVVLLIIISLSNLPLSQIIAQLQPSISETNISNKTGNSGIISNRSQAANISLNNDSAQNGLVNMTSLDAYRNSNNITLQYPSNWRVVENSLPDYTQVVSFFSPLDNLTDSSPARASVSRIDFLQNVTLDEYTNLSLNTTKSFGINLTRSSETMLGSMPAYQFVIESPSDRMMSSTEIMQTWAVKDNAVYIFTFSADTNKFSRYMPLINEMIKSFQLDMGANSDQ